MTDRMTPEQIQQACELAPFYTKMDGVHGVSARALLALAEQLDESEAARQRLADFIGDSVLAEQQPEPVSRDEIVDMFEGEFADDPTYVVVEHMLSRYTITRKAAAEPNDGKPICDCGEPVERWGQPCEACRIPADPEDAAERARGYQPDSEAEHE